MSDDLKVNDLVEVFKGPWGGCTGVVTGLDDEYVYARMDEDNRVYRIQRNKVEKFIWIQTKKYM